MSSPLYSAVARCHVRRLLGLAAANPLAALAITAVVLASPLACLRLGTALGAELLGSLGAHGVADGILAGPALAAAVAGMALAVSFPGRSALGTQIAAAPFSGRDAVVAACVVPGLGGLLLVLPPLVALSTALAVALDRDVGAGIAVAIAILAAVPGGAILAEGMLAAWRGSWRQAGYVVAGTAAWASLGTALGNAALGPLAPVANALRENRSPWLACAAACTTLLGLGCGWVPLAARRPGRGRRTRSSSTRLVRPHGALLMAIAALLVRRADVRLASTGGVAFGVGGVLLAMVAEAPAPAAFMLGTTTALLGSVVASLAVSGIVRSGSWLWLAAPRSRAAIGRASWAVALLLTSGPVIVVGAAALVVSPATRSAVGTVVVLALLAVDVAVVAGTLLPWRGGAGDQLSTLAAFGATAIATSLAVGLVAPRLASLGIPDPAIAFALCCAGAGGAIVALRRGLEGERA